MNGTLRTDSARGLRTTLAAVALAVAGISQARCPEAGDAMAMDPLTWRSQAAAGASAGMALPPPDKARAIDAVSIWYAPELRRWQPAAVLPEPQRSARAPGRAGLIARLG